MNRLIGLIFGHLGDQVEYSLKRAVSPLAPYLKGLALGVGCLFLGCLAFSLTLVMLGVALFTHSAGYGNLVSASLWTALAFAGACLLLLFAGLRLLRKPR